jgi:hypothetical protein
MPVTICPFFVLTSRVLRNGIACLELICEKRYKEYADDCTSLEFETKDSDTYKSPYVKSSIAQFLRRFLFARNKVMF